MSDTSGGLRLAAEVGTGASGALVVFALILASAALFVFLSRSLRRMRANVASGQFGADRAEGLPPTGSGEAAGDDPVDAGTSASGDRAGLAPAAPSGAAGTGTLPRQRAEKGTGEDPGSTSV